MFGLLSICFFSESTERVGSFLKRMEALRRVQSRLCEAVGDHPHLVSLGHILWEWFDHVDCINVPHLGFKLFSHQSLYSRIQSYDAMCQTLMPENLENTHHLFLKPFCWDSLWDKSLVIVLPPTSSSSRDSRSWAKMATLASWFGKKVQTCPNIDEILWRKPVHIAQS